MAEYEHALAAVQAWFAEHECGEECEGYEWDEFSYAETADAAWSALETALWVGVDTGDEDGELAHGRTAEDVHVDTMQQLAGAVADFCHMNARDLAGIGPGQIGHDFVLTRGGHGAGFWDRGLGERGDRLTANAQPYGEFTLYVGDDDTIHG